MTKKEIFILEHIAKRRRISSQVLGRETNTHKAQITRITRMLNEKGLIRKYKDGIYRVFNIVPSVYETWKRENKAT